VSNAPAAHPERQYSLYVVGLDAKKLFAARRVSSPDITCLYVGSTVKTPRERFEQHRSGVKAARVVRDFPLKLRMGFVPKGWGPYATRKEAERAEKRLKNRLNVRKNYKVWGGH
jgi:predicted GIY-YIG superfamily endonuclease